ncbi:unnamed protein product [Calypogeia fissa]
MMGLGGGLAKPLCTTFILFLSLATIIGGINGQAVQSCATNLLLPSSVTSLGIATDFCQQVPVAGASPSANYNLWYKRDNSTVINTLSIILMVPRETAPRWYGMGFNSVNQMAGTDAIIFWLSPSSNLPVWGNYYLSVPDISGVNVDNTKLTYKTKPQVIVEASSLYLVYEVEETNAGQFLCQNFVMGQPSDVPTGDKISGQQQHQGESSVIINFVTGSAIINTLNVDGKRRTHGILNIIGWGVLLPIGTIVARYARGFDPLWFYFHAVCQVIGYGFVLAGLITGIKLYEQLPGVGAGDHRALGIFLFVLATIQISAILIRPKREAKLRRYWNWGHWWLGRFALVIAAANIFVGIHLANASSTWRIGYGVVLGVELFVVVVLEILLWVNYARSKNESQLPQTAMQDRNTNGAPAPPQPYETNWDGKP